MINIFSIVSLISFILCLTLGIFVYFKEVRYRFNNKLEKIFVFLCLSLAFFWAIIEFGYRFAINYNTALFWLKINILWYFVISLLLHFILLLTENSKLLKNKITYFLMYTPAIIFFLLDLNTNLLLTQPIKQSWGWTYGVPQHPTAYIISTTWAAFTGLFCIYICLDHYFNMNNLSKKKIIKYTIIGLLIPMTISLHTEWLFPMMNIQFPEMMVPALTVGILIIWFTTIKSSKSNIYARYKYIKKEVDALS